jgi:LmbE family N-acetylglucosaminyl deacetylase
MSNNLDLKENILMIVAHPDDESLFGFTDIINNNCTIICLSQAYIGYRKEQFEEVLKISNSPGVILDFNHRDDWENISLDTFYNAIFPYIKLPYNAVVSHGEDGEYGHIQHIRTNLIAKYVAEKIGSKFYDFRSRFDKKNYGDKHNDLLYVYIKCGVDDMRKRDPKLQPSASGREILTRTILKYKYFFDDDWFEYAKINFTTLK